MLSLALPPLDDAVITILLLPCARATLLATKLVPVNEKLRLGCPLIVKLIWLALLIFKMVAVTVVIGLFVTLLLAGLVISTVGAGVTGAGISYTIVVLSDAVPSLLLAVITMVLLPCAKVMYSQ